MIYSVIKDGVVINTIVWDGKAEWSNKKADKVVKHSRASIGDKYKNNKFYRDIEDEDGNKIETEMKEV